MKKATKAVKAFKAAASFFNGIVGYKVILRLISYQPNNCYILIVKSSIYWVEYVFTMYKQV